MATITHVEVHDSVYFLFPHVAMALQNFKNELDSMDLRPLLFLPQHQWESQLFTLL